MRDPNTEIERLLTEADQALEEAFKVTEKRLLGAYRKALNEVQAKIREVFASYPNPTLTEMRKFNRLTSIEAQIVEEIRKLTQIAVNTTSAAVKAQFLQSYSDTGAALKIGSGLEIVIGKLPVAAIEYAVSDNLWLDLLKQANAKLITDVKREFETVLRTNAREEVVAGLAQGKGYSSVAAAIEKRFGVSASRANLIATQEMGKSHSKGRTEGILRGGKAAEDLGYKPMKTWNHNTGTSVEPRPEHVAAGQPDAPNHKVPYDKPFDVGGELLEGPRLGADPANNINCHCSAQFQLEGL